MKLYASIVVIFIQLLTFGCSKNSADLPTDRLRAVASMQERFDGERNMHVVSVALNALPDKPSKDDSVTENLDNLFSFGPVKLTGGDYFTAEFNGQTKTLVKPSGSMLRYILGVEDDVSTLALSQMASPVYAEFPSLPEGGEMTVTFHRGNGEEITHTFEFPAAVELIAPTEGDELYYHENDFDIVWDVNQQGEDVVAKIVHPTSNSPRLRFVLPVEQGSIAFSAFEENWYERYGDDSWFPFEGDTRIFVQTVKSFEIEETPFGKFNGGINRIESDVIVNLVP